VKTLEQMIGRESACLDGRDMSRLASFIPESDLKKFGLELKEEFVGKHEHKAWTRENILAQLKEDVAFGFEKALDKRGLSSGLMYAVVRMWNFVLEEGLEDFDKYAQYGLPLFKATAEKYGFPNPISSDAGDEPEYESD